MEATPRRIAKIIKPQPVVEGAGVAPPEPGDRPRLQADDAGRNAGAPPALRVLCRGRALGVYKSTKKYDGGVGREQHGYPPPEQLPL